LTVILHELSKQIKSLKSNEGIFEKIYEHIYKIICYQDYYDLNKHIHDLNIWINVIKKEVEKNKIKQNKLTTYINKEINDKVRQQIRDKVDRKYTIPKVNNNIKTVDEFFDRLIISMYNNNTSQILKQLKQYVEDNHENSRVTW